MSTRCLRRRLVPTRLLAGFVAAAGVSAAAIAGSASEVRSTDADAIEPQLPRAVLHSALESCRATRDSRTLADLMYDDYRASLEDLAFEQDALEAAAGRDQLDAVLSGRVRLSPEEMRTIRADVVLARAPIWSDAAAALDLMLEDIAMTMPPDVAECLQASLPRIRRAVYLVSDPEGLSTDPDQPVTGIDLSRVVEQATLEELSGIPAASLAPILATWEAAIDRDLATVAASAHAARLDRTAARIRRDQGAATDADRTLASALERLRVPTMLAAERIEVLAEQAGGPAARLAWRDRILGLQFPSLYDEREPIEMVAWFRRNVGDAALIGQAEEAVAIWRNDRRRCVEAAIALMIEARRDAGVIVHARSDPSLLPSGRPTEIHRELLQNSGAIEAVDRAAAERIGALLEPGPRRKMRADVRAVTVRRRR